jgi:DNA polymerase-1
MSRPRLTLIDGSGYLYRAFHALPPLANRSGEPTGALYGVFNMLRVTLKEHPTHVAFLADAPGPTFRDELFADYKAQRAPMPDDLRGQVEPMLKLVAALGFPILRVDGVEADDVIGTLARQATADGFDVVVSTGDKDLAQLVDAHVTLVNTMTSSTLDPDGVVQKFGVRADQIIDYLALVGDAIDNIPGVPKCGPKTAAKWLNEYGSLDALIANADKVGGKIGENLRAALPQLPLSRQLATIKTDVALDLTASELHLREPDTALLRELYERYEFRAALKDLDARADDGAAPPDAQAAPAAGVPEHRIPAPLVDKNYELVMTQAHFETWLERLSGADLIAFDCETTSLDPMRAEIVGVAFAVAPGHAAYVPLAHDYAGAPAQLDRARVLAALRPLLEDPARAKLGQHQ